MSQKVGRNIPTFAQPHEIEGFPDSAQLAVPEEVDLHLNIVLLELLSGLGEPPEGEEGEVRGELKACKVPHQVPIDNGSAREGRREGGRED